MDPAAADAGARRKAEQWMRVAEKLLMAKDLEGCKEFSAQALAADKGTPGAEDLHAAAEVLLAAQRRRMPNGKPDPYAVLGIDPASPASRHPDVVHSSYRRLSLLLNQSQPDRPSSASLAEAARIVADAWAFLSNPGLKSALDTQLDAAAPLRAYRAPAPMQQQQPQPPLRPQLSPIGAAPQPRPSPQQSPIPAARLPPPPPQPGPLRAAPQPPARAAAPPPLPRQSPIPAARQPPPPPQPSPIPVAPQPPARAPAPPPLQRQSPKWAAPQPRPPPQQSPIPAAHQPPPPPQQSSKWAAPQPRPPPQQSQIRAVHQPRPPPQQSPIPAAHQPPPPTQQSPPRAALQPPSQAAAPPVESDTSPSPTFWTICKTCSHIHQYDRLYEARKLKCGSCHQPFVAEAMTETPPIVPGTDMYYCTWGFFPVGFPGCPGFESLVNKQPQGQDQLNAPCLGANGVVGANGGVEAIGGAGVQNGTPDSAAMESPVVLEPEPLMRMRVQVPGVPEPVMPTRVEVPAMPESVMPTRVEVPTAPKPVKTMRLNSVNVGAKKRGRPKGSKNKKKASMT